MAEPDNQGNNRNPDGTFKDGVSGNPNGRPKGKTIKEQVRDWLDEHPEDLKKYVQYFVNENRELSWTMMEGSPKSTMESKVVNLDIEITGKDLLLAQQLRDQRFGEAN